MPARSQRPAAAGALAPAVFPNAVCKPAAVNGCPWGAVRQSLLLRLLPFRLLEADEHEGNSGDTILIFTRWEGFDKFLAW